jgi:predicted XRE-type DNA-binding protein
MAIRIHRSSGNVFRDLGFADNEAENLRVRADLMISLSKLLEERGLTQAQAVKLLGVTQPRISDLMRVKIQLSSVDNLIEMLGHARAHVSVTVRQQCRQVA